MEKCNSRFQNCDMGYVTCQLEQGHEGKHKFSGKNFFDVEYSINWEKSIKDFLPTEEFIKTETSLNELILNIIDKKNFSKGYDINFVDDSDYGQILALFISFYDFENTDYEILSSEEEYIREYFIKNLKSNDGKGFSEMNFELSIRVTPY